MTKVIPDGSAKRSFNQTVVEAALRQQHSEVGQTARTTIWIGGRAGERGILTVQANVSSIIYCRNST